MNPYFYRIERHFIWRRAFRSADRCVVRADLIEAFGMSGNKASALLTQESSGSDGSLVRNGNKVTAAGWANPPAQAGEVDLMNHIGKGLTDFCFTGLKSHELPINITQWSTSLPPNAGSLLLIVESITRRSSLLMRYVGMEPGNTGKWRRISPVSLDLLGGQWRVSAQDLDNAEGKFPLRSFVLARIIETKADKQPSPKGFIQANGFDSQQRVNIEFHAQLTQAQQQVLTHEYGITNESLTIPSRTVHEFLIHMGDIVPSNAAIRPPLRRSK